MKEIHNMCYGNYLLNNLVADEIWIAADNLKRLDLHKDKIFNTYEEADEAFNSIIEFINKCTELLKSVDFKYLPKYKGAIYKVEREVCSL